MIQEHNKWVIQQLKDWRETFRNEERDEDGTDTNLKAWDYITDLITKLETEQQLTSVEHDNVLFHLWQHLAFKEVE